MTSTDKAIKIQINKKDYHLESREQSGAALKELAGIAPDDVLFLQGRCEDEVIAHDAKVVLRDCDQLHSQPPANYGLAPGLTIDEGVSPDRFAVHEQPDGWKF